MILALDLGTVTGWAIKTESGIDSGIKSFATKSHEGAGMRYLRFKKWLTEIKQCGINEVYFEQVQRHVSTYSAQVYGGYMGTLMAWCEQHEIPYSGVPVGTIKRSATGKGNASKQDMINAAKKLGFDVVDDNQADALALLHCVMSK